MNSQKVNQRLFTSLYYGHFCKCLGYFVSFFSNYCTTNRIAITTSLSQLVTCLATDASLTADPGVVSSIPARSHTFIEIDHEISKVILLPSAESFKKSVVSYKQKYVHEVLVNCLFKLAQDKV